MVEEYFQTCEIGRQITWAPTGLLRWNGGVLEQEFYETFTMNREWRPVPNAEDA